MLGWVFRKRGTMNATVQISQPRPGVALVTIARPERMNAIDPATDRAMGEALAALDREAEVRCIVITGAGDRAFSAGNDLRYQAEGNKIEVPPSGFAGLTARYNLNKPVIAAVNGVAMGGGFEIALACDLIIASENAVFALPEPRVGLAALAGGLHRLPRQIGTKQALGMILTGRQVKAAEGKELGFVNYGKPDVHIKDIFIGTHLCNSKTTDYEYQKVIGQIAEANNVSAYNVDKLFWLVGSGRFYDNPELGRQGNIGRGKERFLAEFAR